MPNSAQKVHRLSDFIIEEVSLVDRAANLRRFLQVKRDDSGGAPQTPIEPDGAGGFTAAIKTLDNAPNLGETMAVNVTKGIEAVEQIFYKVGDAVDRLMRVASVVLQADSLKLGDAALSGSTVSGEIDKVLAVLTAVKADIGVAKSLLADDASPEAVAAATRITDAAANVASLETLAAQIQAAEIEKAGAKMSAGRLSRFANALKDLLSVLEDVGGDTGGLLQPTATTQKVLDVPAAPAQVAAADTAELVAARKQLADAEALAAELRRENAVLKSSPAPSQALSIDHADPQSDEDAVSWPMDMNKPLGRAHVPAEKSFHGAPI